MMKFSTVVVLAMAAALALSSCSSAPHVAAEDRAPAERDGVPSAVRAEVDLVYPGWRSHRVDPEALAFLKSNRLAENPVLVRGDFNDDGLQDVAFLIDQRKVTRLIVAHRTTGAASYRVFFFDEASADYLQLKRKGTGGYDHITGKDFTYPVDAVEANTFEKFAHSFIFTNGIYHMAQTQD